MVVFWETIDQDAPFQVRTLTRVALGQQCGSVGRKIAWVRAKPAGPVEILMVASQSVRSNTCADAVISRTSQMPHPPLPPVEARTRASVEPSPVASPS